MHTDKEEDAAQSAPKLLPVMHNTRDGLMPSDLKQMVGFCK